ncbi:MAG: hypothetical protein HC807_08320, partial [Gammaproteobacteria bacterium]|nr:hypothetical protein [Gammaproteobacteria bacterium]
MPLFDELSAVIGWATHPAEWKRFLASLDIGFDQWHDGTGYDLEALAAMNAEERAMIRQWLRSRVSSALFEVEWRDLEAANALGDSELLESLRNHPHRETRLRVKNLLADRGGVEQEICRSIREATTLGELSRSLALVPDHPTADVKQAIIARLRQNDQWFVSTA